MSKLIDLSGKRFGRLTVIERYGTYISPADESKAVTWLCRCDCGAKTVVLGSNLKSGRSQSCGCLRREKLKGGLTMANEKRLIDANALIAEYDRVHIGEPGKARKLIEDAPTVEAVEIVRCRDCKHRYSDSWCEYVDDNDNFYCAKGKRKDGDGNG